MFTVVITEKGGAQRRMDFDKAEVTIGRVQGNDIILPKGNVSKRHSRIVLKDKRFIVVDLKSTNGTYVNGRKITSPLVVKPGDKIYIGDFIMAVEGQGLEAEADAGAEAESVEAVAPAQPSVPPPLNPQPSSAAPPKPTAPPSAPPPPLGGSMPPASPTVPPPAPAPPSSAAPAGPAAVTAPPAQRATNPVADAGAQGPSYVPPQPTAPPAAAAAPAAQLRSPQAPSAQAGPAQSQEAALRMLMGHLSQHFDVANTDANALGNQDRWDEAQSLVQASMNVLSGALGNVDRDALGQAALREAVGLGPLEDLLANDSVRELVVEGNQRILVDSGDGLKAVAEQFSSNFSVMIVAQRLCAQAGTLFSAASPIQHAALPYGPHVTVVMPPVAVRGPIIEVRRMGGGRKLEDLSKKGVINDSINEILRAAVDRRKNVLVAGPVDSGVTDLIGAIASCLDADTRVATVESTPDLVVDGPHVLSLSSGQPGTGLSLSDVVGEASQLRVDWLVVDDARGGSAKDILETIRCRRAGNIVGLRTAPGQKPEDTLQAAMRLNGQSDVSINQLVADSVDLMIQMDVNGNGETRAVRVVEVTGPGESMELVTHDGEFQSSGSQASFQ